MAKASEKIILPFLALSLLFPAHAWAEMALNLQAPATIIARDIYDLHNLILLVCLFIFIVVFGFMFYALYKHRKSVGHEAVQFSHHTKLEYVWTVIPMLILVGMAYPTTLTILAMKDTGSYDMNVKVTGHQWHWEYEYMGEDVRFASNLATGRDQIDNKVAKGVNYLLETDRPLVVPTGKKVRVLLTSEDVIHAWWVPKFGVKQDAIPGFIKETWFRVDAPGFYRGQCAELCGTGHGFMPIVVEAVPPEKFTAWLQQQKADVAVAATATAKTFALEELQTFGAKVFNTNCAVCHQANGQGVAGAFPPLVDGAAFTAADEMTAPLAQRGFWKAGKIVLGNKAQHLDIVMHGIPGTVMPAFDKQLTDLDIAAVISYERNNWGNHTGDVIQPAEIEVMRKPKG